MDIAIVTYSKYAELGWDGQQLIAALAERGLQAQPVLWDDPHFDWSIPRLALLHATWDYYLRPAEFLEWVRLAASKTQLCNGLETVLWNSHKGYLRELEAAGVPIIPTVWLDKPASTPNLAALLKEQNWSQAVIKPAVSAGAYGTQLVTPTTAAAAQADFEKLVANGTVLVQPYLSTLFDYGERNLIFIDGVFSHCVNRPSRLLENGDREAGELVSVEPTAAEYALACQVLELVSQKFPLLYVRVDLVQDEAGQTRLLEVELIEPYLMLEKNPPAVQKLAEALAARL